MSFASLLRGLIDARIAFVVVGGVAGAAHGSTRVTNDLDICYDTERENVERLAALLARWDAYPREIEPGLPFFMDARQLRSTPVMTLATNEGDIDVLDSVISVGRYDAVHAHSTNVDAFDVRFAVLDLPSLIKAKRATKRQKDLDQLPELEALMALRST